MYSCKITIRGETDFISYKKKKKKKKETDFIIHNMFSELTYKRNIKSV